MRRWQIIRSTSAPRHIHRSAYVSILISGGYEEAGDFGRFFLEPGDVLIHEKFEAHLNRFQRCGATVLNLPLAGSKFRAPGLFHLVDLDRVVRTAERDPREVCELLHSCATAKKQSLHDWPDELAAAMRRNPNLRLREWGASNGLQTWSLTRGFQQVFETTPEGFRARAKMMLALERICATRESLASISIQSGFSDQSHMCHSIRTLTGKPPNAWRSANGHKTASGKGTDGKAAARWADPMQMDTRPLR